MLEEAQIKQIVEETCKSQGVKLLFAAESGSRGWGFSSHDSDYDLRFIFAPKVDDHLSPFQMKEDLRIQIPALSLDGEGWSLAKAVRSLYKGNSVVLEWAQSPIKYFDYLYNGVQPFSKVFLSAFDNYLMFHPGSTVGHYLGMTKKALGGLDLANPNSSIRVKSLFYALRASLAGLYTCQHGRMPPMAWQALYTPFVEQNPDLKGTLETLLELKRSSGEKEETVIPPEIAFFLSSALQTLNGYMDSHEKINLNRPKTDFSHFYQKAILACD